jgi:hypothetical protein
MMVESVPLEFVGKVASASPVREPSHVERSTSARHDLCW